MFATVVIFLFRQSYNLTVGYYDRHAHRLSWCLSGPIPHHTVPNVEQTPHPGPIIRFGQGRVRTEGRSRDCAFGREWAWRGCGRGRPLPWTRSPFREKIWGYCTPGNFLEFHFAVDVFWRHFHRKKSGFQTAFHLMKNKIQNEKNFDFVCTCTILDEKQEVYI